MMDPTERWMLRVVFLALLMLFVLLVVAHVPMGEG